MADRFFIHTEDLLGSYKSLPLGTTTNSVLLRAYGVVRLQHIWGAFSRSLIMASAIGGYQTGGNLTILHAPTITSVRQARKVVGNVYDGPGANWHDPNFAVGQAKKLGIINYNQISLGLGPAPFDEVKAVRNYLVHPNEWTRTRYDPICIKLAGAIKPPDELICSKVHGGGTIFEGWIAKYRICALNAIK